MIKKSAERLAGIRDSVIEAETRAIEEFEPFTGVTKKTRKSYKDKTLLERIEEGLRATKDWDENNAWEEFMKNESSKSGGRSRMRRHRISLMHGHAVTPKGKECHAWGKTIIETNNHVSMKNSKFLVDDEEFLIMAAQITPSPKRCSNFFYDYVNKYLKINKSFRMKFLKSLYKNKNFLLKDDILWFVETYGFQEEQEKLVSDLVFKKELKTHLDDLKSDVPGYLSSWENMYEKREHQRYAKTMVDANKKMQQGIDELLSMFKSEEELIEDEVDDLF